MIENDWLMRQLKSVGTGIGLVLKKELSSIELGEIKVNEGELVSRKELIMVHLEEGEFQEAFLLVNALKYKMSFYEFKLVASWFIEYLKNVRQNHQDAISSEQIANYQEKLNDVL